MRTQYSIQKVASLLMWSVCELATFSLKLLKLYSQKHNKGKMYLLKETLAVKVFLRLHKYVYHSNGGC